MEAAKLYQEEFDTEAQRQERIRVKAEIETAHRMKDPVDYDCSLTLDTLMSKQNLETLAELAKGKDELAIGRLFMKVMEAEILSEELDKAARDL